MPVLFDGMCNKIYSYFFFLFWVSHMVSTCMTALSRCSTWCPSRRCYHQHCPLFDQNTFCCRQPDAGNQLQHLFCLQVHPHKNPCNSSTHLCRDDFSKTAMETQLALKCQNKINGQICTVVLKFHCIKMRETSFFRIRNPFWIRFSCCVSTASLSIKVYWSWASMDFNRALDSLMGI